MGNRLAAQRPSLAPAAANFNSTAMGLTENQLSARLHAQNVSEYIRSGPKVVGWYDGVAVDSDGIYLSRAAGDYGEEEKPIKHNPMINSLEFMPGVQLGSGDSHHNVLFAEVVFADSAGASIKCDVALKSFSAESHAAEKEHNALVEASRRGLTTFEPLAIARHGDETFLITEVMPNVETLDGIDWTVQPSDRGYESHVVPELRFIVEQMALMHSRGIFHGDMQPKNVGRNDEGHHVLLDLEDASVSMSEEEHVLYLTGGWDVAESKALADLKHCWYVLTHPTQDNQNNILYKGLDFETCMAEFQNNFVGPYLKELRRLLPLNISNQFDSQAFLQTLTTKVAAIT